MANRESVVWGSNDGGCGSRAPHFQALSEEQSERVYQAALECLYRTGVNVLNADARSLLAAAGANVDRVRVRFPPHIIREAIASVPPSFALWGRDGLHQIRLSPGEVHFGPGPTCTYFVDPESGERRMACREDVAMTALLCDALDNIDYVMGLGLVGDVTPELAPVYEFAEMVANTSKPLLAWGYSAESVADIYRIAVAVAGSEESLRQRPFFALFANCQQPLVHTDQDMANVLWAVENDVPIVYLGGATLGVTAPITGAGLLVVCLAEALSGLAIVQLKKRGAPVCLGGVPNSMDLLNCRPNYGAPEMSLYSSAMADIACHLGLLFMGTAGASEAKCLDLQAAIESTVQVVLSGLSGATLVHDVGFLDCAELGSLESLVMNDEIISMVRRILTGIEISDDTMMLDLIDEVGPGGEYISCLETAKRCRTEIWNPTLFDRKRWGAWRAAGAKTLNDSIKEKLWGILTTHKPTALPDGVPEKIEAILEQAEVRTIAMKSDAV